MPSDFVRVIDVVSAGGISTLPSIEIHVGYDGRLARSLIGCPTLGSPMVPRRRDERMAVGN
eukprot:6018168-Lingulodinium_polyedra.AAC.1